jgi:ubiquinone/menaquinone biosynthesis C-methylase UbiE
VSSPAAAASRLASFYGALSPSLETISTALREAGIEPGHVLARDLYQRDLDCHNLGMHKMLEVLAESVARHGAPTTGDVLLDVGCGLGGPGRFLVDRFGCTVVGIDLLPLRVELAEALSDQTGMSNRASYRVGDATKTEFEDDAFSQVWMLDVGIHIRAKEALFAEIARVLRPGGLFVMHDQTGPLPRAMLPLKRLAPWVAPSLPHLIRIVERAGMRLLTWTDTTDRVLEYFLGIRAALVEASRAASRTPGNAQRERGATFVESYIETLGNLDGRTGILIAKRREGDSPVQADQS